MKSEFSYDDPRNPIGSTMQLGEMLDLFFMSRPCNRLFDMLTERHQTSSSEYHLLHFVESTFPNEIVLTDNPVLSG